MTGAAAIRKRRAQPSLASRLRKLQLAPPSAPPARPSREELAFSRAILERGWRALTRAGVAAVADDGGSRLGLHASAAWLYVVELLQWVREQELDCHVVYCVRGGGERAAVPRYGTRRLWDHMSPEYLKARLHVLCQPDGRAELRRALQHWALVRHLLTDGDPRPVPAERLLDGAVASCAAELRVESSTLSQMCELAVAMGTVGPHLREFDDLRRAIDVELRALADVPSKPA